MTSRLIGSCLSDSPSSPVKALVKCFNLRDHFGCRVKDYSAARIPFSNIMGHHPRPTSCLIGKSLTPLAEVQSVYSTSSANRVGNDNRRNDKKKKNVLNIEEIRREKCFRICKLNRKHLKTYHQVTIMMTGSTYIRIILGGARGVVVVVAGIEHSDTSSNPGLIAFHITLIPLGKV